MKFLRPLIVGFLALCAAPAFADTACYSPKQMQAEQLLRLHSELMVIAVTCRQGSDGQDLSLTYVSFTKRNLRALHDAEQTMIAYYKATRKGDAVDDLDSLRTRLGNEFGQKAAQMSAPKFCALYRDKIAELNIASPSALDSKTRAMAASEHAYVKPCGESRQIKKGR